MQENMVKALIAYQPRQQLTPGVAINMDQVITQVRSGQRGGTLACQQRRPQMPGVTGTTRVQAGMQEKLDLVVAITAIGRIEQRHHGVSTRKSIVRNGVTHRHADNNANGAHQTLEQIQSTRCKLKFVAKRMLARFRHSFKPL